MFAQVTALQTKCFYITITVAISISELIYNMFCPLGKSNVSKAFYLVNTD